jgi:glycosyltransferase involved in cell wall biosynthesis
MARHVDEVDRILSRSGIRYRWLLLGRIPPEWFRFETRPLAPGHLGLADLSAHLQMGDIFLVPHRSGLSARRTTFLAALEHGLPVVGTEGPMTDGFLRDVAGISLFGRRAAADAAGHILRLGRDPELRRRLGRQNAAFYREHFSWSLVGRRFAECIGSGTESETAPGHEAECKPPAHAQPALIRP